MKQLPSLQLIVTFLITSLFSFHISASSSNYYPANLRQAIEKNTIKDDELKSSLFVLLNSTHKRVAGYSKAKQILFGTFFLKQDARGYFVTDVYCHKDFTNGIGPGRVPDSNQINCEHTWPQSKFSKAFPDEMQKSDLHHLFPSDSKANTTRGNFDFADVTVNTSLGSDCQSSKSGPSTIDGGKNYFEPPTIHKGNVARALFYFSIRYQLPIPKSEEEFLKRWNDLDPVDAEEMARNNEIEKIQGDRNPFIDFPAMPHSVRNF